MCRQPMADVLQGWQLATFGSAPRPAAWNAQAAEFVANKPKLTKSGRNSPVLTHRCKTSAYLHPFSSQHPQLARRSVLIAQPYSAVFSSFSPRADARRCRVRQPGSLCGRILDKLRWTSDQPEVCEVSRLEVTSRIETAVARLPAFVLSRQCPAAILFCSLLEKQSWHPNK